MKGKKTGGRQKGTPNIVHGPIKDLLRAHSEQYFTPRIQHNPVTGQFEEISDFDLQLQEVEPAARVGYEIKLLEFHTPKMKSIDVDLEANVKSDTLEDAIARLIGEDE